MISVVRRSVEIIEAFRGICLSYGYAEHSRVPLVSGHDPSLRFTNSTISVLKPILASGAPHRTFLVQPALRLRNLTFWQRTGRMSGYGCYFTAFGALAPPGELGEVHRLVREFLHDRLEIPISRLRLNVSSCDPDFLSTSRVFGAAVNVDGYEQQRYRHRFGMPEVSGRNANIAIEGHHGWTDVANIIQIERLGQPLGVEVAFGVNVVLAQMTRLDHPVRASVGALAGRYGFDDLIAQDALGSATVLAMEGMRPVARGRGGNYRSFLRILADAEKQGPLHEAVSDVAQAEHLIRSHASPLRPEQTDLAPEASAWQVLADLAHVTKSRTQGGR